VDRSLAAVGLVPFLLGGLGEMVTVEDVGFAVKLAVAVNLSRPMNGFVLGDLLAAELIVDASITVVLKAGDIQARTSRVVRKINSDYGQGAPCHLRVRVADSSHSSHRMAAVLGESCNNDVPTRGCCEEGR
jgi:hypothetical protein